MRCVDGRGRRAGRAGAPRAGAGRSPSRRAAGAADGRRRRSGPPRQPPRPPTCRCGPRSIGRRSGWPIRVTYTVTSPARRARHPDDDLPRDKLKLDGLEVVSTNRPREQTPAGRRVRTFTYHLTTYKVDQRGAEDRPTDGALLRAARRARHRDAAPAGEVQVPGAMVAFRSMLPEIRTRIRCATAATAGAAAAAVGAGAAGRARPVHRRHRARRCSGSLGAGRERRPQEGAPVDPAGAAGGAASLDAVARDRRHDVRTDRREAYTKIDALVREHLRRRVGVPGPSLTPAEVEPALAGTASTRCRRRQSPRC